MSSLVDMAFSMLSETAPKARGPLVAFSQEAYRKAVAKAPCCACGQVGQSQAAHANSLALGKGRQIKAPDYCIFALCLKCHLLHDLYVGKATKSERIDTESAYIIQTFGWLIANRYLGIRQ